MQASNKPTDSPSGETREANLDQEPTQPQELLLKLRARQGFIDALHNVIYTAEHPPAASEVIGILERSLTSVVGVTVSEVRCLNASGR